MKKIFRTLAALALTLCMLLLPVSALDLEQARELVARYYVDELPEGVFYSQSLEDLIACLEDPYTAYLTPEEYRQFLDSINDDRVVGIGVSIQNAEQGLLIASVLPDSPALEAGLEAGDVILAVDGTVIQTIEEGSALIGGEEGTSVHLTIQKKDGSITGVDLVRRTVSIPTTVQYALSIDGNAGVIRCNTFGDGTAEHFTQALTELDDSVNAWIVDLTSNPGGTDMAAAASAGCFIGGGVMVFFRDGQGDYYYTFNMPGTPVLTQKPAILLTSPYTASGAELFSADIRDYGAGIAIGGRTYGKGVAQYLFDEAFDPELFDGDALKLTVYRFFSPNGTTNDQIGLLPTLLLSPDNSAYAALLLCSAQPEQTEGFLKLELAGWEFFIRVEQALNEEYRPAFVELLEALPPAAALYQGGTGGQWTPVTPAALAETLGLTEFVPRTFTDLEDCPQADAIHTLSAYRILGGYGDGTFHPQDNVTRAEFCAMLTNLLGLDLPAVTESAFSDVPAESWYAPAVNAVYRRGLMGGYGDGTFRPDASISQEEIVTVLASLGTQLNMYCYENALLEPTAEELAPFSQYSGWAQKSAWLLSEGELDLSGLSPQESATRATAADLIWQLMVQISLLWL